MNTNHVSHDCFHCGEPVPAATYWTATINGLTQAMCCPGCQAVAEAIVASGCEDYYLTRSAYSLTADKIDTIVPAQLRAYDVGQTQSAQIASDNSLTNRKNTAEYTSITSAIFSIEGIRCAACVWLVERRLSKLPGILSADLNVSSEKLSLRWDTLLCQPSQIISTLREIGYTAHPFEALKHGELIRRHSKQLFRQLFIAGLSMMQVMMYTFPLYFSHPGEMEADHIALLRWASLLLTLPAIGYSAQPFFKGAWFNIKTRQMGMDVPVSIGLLAAFFASAVATYRQQGDVYFDSVTMFIFLLLCSRYLELRARRKAFDGLEKLQHALPVTATRLQDYPHHHSSELVAASELHAGDIVLIRQGDVIATDSMIIEGSTTIDASLLSGESKPLSKNTNDELPGGAINIEQTIIAKVSRCAADSHLAVIIRLTENASATKPHMLLWADQVASRFVTCLLVFALLVFCIWYLVDPAQAWPVTIAVLIASCPCALSLATPTALASATDRLLKQGVLIMRSATLETMTHVSHVVFDKTGTLTQGKPTVQSLCTFGAMTGDQCLQLAASLEQASSHAIAHAITRALKAATIKNLIKPDTTAALDYAIHVADIDSKPGQGLQASKDGITYRIGNQDFIEDLLGKKMMHPALPEVTSVYLANQFELLARFDLQDSLRDGALETVTQLQTMGKKIILLSGDDQNIVESIARQSGITEAYGNRLPEQKLQFIQTLQHAGAVVAMVGDGINDAAVLSAADISFAMGGGSSLAQVSADAVLLSDKLSALIDTINHAKKTTAIIRQNLVWASIYNLIVIPAAAFGYLPPLISGVGMTISSMVVVLNALRLHRLPKSHKATPASNSEKLNLEKMSVEKNRLITLTTSTPSPEI
ncbi:Cu2+-exporting ATPase [Undibacterium sp. GrIS 1.2]|uniref:heavy metal translocating P-type ATPase n=1 Tax=Undibacterium sp. GrIS 1.2 TaxID=3143933 RepID=UPI0033988F3C